jgi:hypothetical protein
MPLPYQVLHTAVESLQGELVHGEDLVDQGNTGTISVPFEYRIEPDTGAKMRLDPP